MNKEIFFQGIGDEKTSLVERNKFSLLFLQEHHSNKKLIESIIDDDSLELYHPSILFSIILMTKSNHNINKLDSIYNKVKINYK